MLGEIDKEECIYLENSRILLPVLVLAVKEKFKFKKGRKWIPIAHQTAGNLCHQHYMIGTLLKPKNVNILNKIREIDREWYGSNYCIDDVSLDKVLLYRVQLKDLLDVDCNDSYKDFEEGIYPIDCDVKTIRKLSSDKIPNDIDRLINWGLEDIVRHAHWNIYILGRNSD